MSIFRSQVYPIEPNARCRASVFYDATLADGVQAFTTYNQMMMPTGYGDPEAEYWRLINGVSMWDVAAQRQVELTGTDAARLAQILSTRNLDGIKTGQGKYAPLCNHAGTLINDPVILKIDDSRWLISIADSNILFWARAICAERNLNVEIREPDISPLAIQGPKAEDVIASIFGDWIRKIRYFRFEFTEIERIPVMLSRSGYSKQGGFELYLLDGNKGTALWNAVKEAGQPWGIRPGCPNQTERVESGLLSFGADNDDTTNPFEVRLGRYVDLSLPDDVIGIEALRKIQSEGVKRHQLGIIVEGDQPVERNRNWIAINLDNRKIGDVTTMIWSWKFGRNIGFALVDASVKPGTEVEVAVNSKHSNATLAELPFRL